MIGHKLLNKTKSATVTETKKFLQLNRPIEFYYFPTNATGSGRLDQLAGAWGHVRYVCV
jgi:hypothetical protein